MNTTTTKTLTHAQREHAAYTQWYAAAMRKDWVEASRLWHIFAEIHKERPAEVVRAMEKARGLA